MAAEQSIQRRILLFFFCRILLDCIFCISDIGYIYHVPETKKARYCWQHSSYTASHPYCFYWTSVDRIIILVGIGALQFSAMELLVIKSR